MGAVSSLRPQVSMLSPLRSFHLSGSLGAVLWALNRADLELRPEKPRLTETEERCVEMTKEAKCEFYLLGVNLCTR